MSGRNPPEEIVDGYVFEGPDTPSSEPTKVEKVSKLRSGITPGERAALETAARAGDREAAAFLGRPAPSGRPQLTDWARANKAFRLLLYRKLIADEIGALKESGDKPRGGYRDTAIQNVADRVGVSKDQILNLMKGK